MVTASIILFIIYLGALILMGVKMSQKENTMESYWMAERNLPAYRIGFCLAASWFGLSSFTGQAGWLYGEGLGALFYLAFPNFAAIFIIAVVFAKKIRSIPGLSQPEFLEMRYSGAIRPLLAIVVLIAFAGYTAMEVIALQYVFGDILGWSPMLGVLLVALVTFLYVTLGGMKTVVWTEVVQYCLLFLVGAIVGIAGIVKGIDLINSGAVAGIEPGTSIWSVPNLGEGGPSWWSLASIGIGFVIIYIVAYWPAWSTEQSPWQRIWMAADTKTARRGALYGTFMNMIVYIFSIFMAVAAWVIIGAPGAQAADFNPELIVYLLMMEVLPEWIIPVILVGFLAAAMSNMSNFATSSATNLAKDVYQRYARPHATQKEMVLVSRICIAITLVLGIFVGMIMPSILNTVIAAASIATCGYFIPIVGALYWRRGTSQGAVASMILGGGGFLVAYIGSTWGGWVFPIDPVIIFVIVALVAYVVVSLLTPPSSTAKLAAFFPQDAKKYIEEWKAEGITDEATADSVAFVDANVTEKIHGERSTLFVTYQLGESFTTSEAWEAYCDKLLKNKSWVWLAGYDIIYKITHDDMLSNVRLARGQNPDEVVIYCEPTLDRVEYAKQSIAVAIDDLKALG